jgi:D-glycero-D-manno-heptose 1,7-bisphosphate phosphatase
VVDASTDPRLVILDRDGVINQDSAGFIKSADEWLPLPGSIAAIASLSAAGFVVAVASNQSGLARNLFDTESLEAMHQKLRELVVAAGGYVDRIIVCPHGPNDGCECRKPKPGMLLELGRDYGVSLQGVPMVGDSLRDLQAASAAGAKPVLVRTGNGAYTERHLPPDLLAVDVYDDLAAAAAALVGS